MVACAHAYCGRGRAGAAATCDGTRADDRTRGRSRDAHGADAHGGRATGYGLGPLGSFGSIRWCRGLGQQLGEMVSGLMPSLGEALGDPPDLDEPDDALELDEDAHEDEDDKEEDDEEAEEQKAEPDPESEPEEPAAVEKPEAATVDATADEPMPSPPVPEPPAPTPPPAPAAPLAEPIAPPPGPDSATPCEIAANEVPQVGE